MDCVLDIGGQDMKCIKLHNGSVDNVLLNEACSSGCGSFIETFARSMGYSIEEFCKLGLFAQHPIDLGSRCTVFMNSSVKQAQKDGAGIDAISAGLSVSVVKNALYKVIRAHSPDDLGQHIVVQGGTFLNDAILRSFEQEIGRDVTRPAISGLMGAYGAALHAKDNRRDTTTLIGTDILAGFEHNVRSTRCGLCENHCNLTINDFGGGRRFISGNRCERPLGGTKKADLPNLYKWKLEKLKSYIHYIYGFYGFGLWAVCLKESGRLIGRCGLQVEFIQDQGEYELGYMISGKYGRKGYGKEAVTAILEYAEEELEAPRVILRIDTENEPSRRFAENMGFRLMTEATEKKSDVCLYIYDL